MYDPEKDTLRPLERVSGPRPKHTEPPILEIRVARTLAEVVRCQYLIAGTYNKWYGVVFTAREARLDAKIEPYPHHYVMGLVDGELIATAGLYVRDTYVMRYGGITHEDIRAELERSGLQEEYPTYTLREYTKLVVDDAWSGLGIGRFFFGATHSRDFVNLDGASNALMLACAKRSIYEKLFRVVRIHSRPLRPFPLYRVHEHYRSDTDAMDSRLVVPERDIHPRWYNLRLPARLRVEDLRSWEH